jgi:hypothetical protein
MARRKRNKQKLSSNKDIEEVTNGTADNDAPGDAVSDLPQVGDDGDASSGSSDMDNTSDPVSVDSGDDADDASGADTLDEGDDQSNLAETHEDPIEDKNPEDNDNQEGEEEVDYLPWMTKYEDDMAPNRPHSGASLIAQQKALLAGITSIMVDRADGRNVLLFTELLNRVARDRTGACDIVYLTRAIADNVPTHFPGWAVALLTLITRTAPIDVRMKAMDQIDIAGMLTGIPEVHLVFLQNYYTSVRIS